MGVILIKFMKVVFFQSSNEREFKLSVTAVCVNIYLINTTVDQEPINGSCEDKVSMCRNFGTICTRFVPSRVALIRNPRLGIQNPRLFLDSYT